MQKFKQMLAKFIAKSLPTLAPDKHDVYRCEGGLIYLNPRESVNVLYRVFDVYEPEKVRLFKQIIREGMTVVDVGVHKGYFTLLFAKLVGPKGLVLSFEPEPRNIPWILKSLEANDYYNVKLFPFALSDVNGLAKFYRGKQLGWGSFFKSESTTNEFIHVATRRLDEVLEREGIKKVDVIKVDVEGADLLVLKGAEKTLRRGCRLAMDLDVETFEERKAVFDFLVGCGMKVYRLGKKIERLKEMDEGVWNLYAFKENKTK